MRCPACEAENPAEAVRCKACGAKLGVPPRQANPSGKAPDEVIVADEVEKEEEEETSSIASTIVPYKNPKALLAYYLGFLSIIAAGGGVAIVLAIVSMKDIRPDDVVMLRNILYIGFGLGIVLALAAFVLGILGLTYVRAHPTAKGTGHAIIAISLGAANVIGQLVVGFLLMQWIKSTFFA